MRLLVLLFYIMLKREAVILECVSFCDRVHCDKDSRAEILRSCTEGSVDDPRVLYPEVGDEGDE